jgi:hypothetical protein
MRFIFNFIFFGILFYLIYLFLPDAFFTLVSWANKTYEFLRDLVMELGSKIHDWRGGSSSGSAPPQQALFLLPLWIAYALAKK